MKKSERNLIIAGVALVAIALVFAFINFEGRGAALSAQNACSCLYVTDDSEKDCREILGVDFKTNEKERSVQIGDYVSKYLNERRGCSVSVRVPVTK